MFSIIPYRLLVEPRSLTPRSYIKPAQCSDPAFRKMWSEFEWENKVTFSHQFYANILVYAVAVAGHLLKFTEQVIICTVIKDTVEFLDHIMHVTNMSCLTPRTLLQVQRASCGLFFAVLRVTCSIQCCNRPTERPLPSSSSDRLPLCRRQPLCQKRESVIIVDANCACVHL